MPRPVIEIVWAVVRAVALVLAVAAPMAAGPQADDGADKKAGGGADVAAARAVFEANLEAIRNQDRDAYLACYLQSEDLARTGPTGMVMGYEGLAASAGEGWPEVFEAQDLRFVSVRPGVVYGTYRYRVRFDGVEQSGLSERVFVDTPAGWKIAVTTAFPSALGTPPPPRALVGATLVDGTGAPPVADAVVVMSGGRVQCAGTREDCPVPEGTAELDVSGHWITPGLVDAHVHYSQTGWADGRPDALDLREAHPYPRVIAEQRASPGRYHRAYLCSGVTAVFDVGGYPWTWELRASSETDTESPHVAAAGPLLSTLDFWLNLPAERQFMHVDDEESAREGVRYLAARGSDAVKVWFIVDPELDFDKSSAAVAAAGDEAAKRGLPLIVHATGLVEAKAAVRAGARLLVHSVWDRPVDDELIALLRERGTVYTPTLTVMDGYRRMAEAAFRGLEPEIDDPNGCVDQGTMAKMRETAELGGERYSERQIEARRERVGRLAATSAENLGRLAAAGIPIAMGTDAGNPLTLHGPSVYAEMEAMQAAGMSAMEVLMAATRTGALAMGRLEDFGTVEAGKIADLLVLAADPSADAAAFRELEFVVRGGVLRPVAELAARP